MAQGDSAPVGGEGLVMPDPLAAADTTTTWAEFTAVVLAGGEGTRLSPLTQGRAKSVLPVCNQAMLSYGVRWLASGGFTKPIIITTESQKQEVESWAAHNGTEMGITPYIHVVGDDKDSAEAVGEVAGKIDRNALVVSCDTITDVPLNRVLTHHRQTQATATIVCRHARTLESKAKERHLTEFIGLEKDNRVVFFASSAEMSDPATGDPVAFKRSFLSRRPNMVLTTSLLDGHIYILNKWVIDLLCQKPKLTSLKHELLPLIVSQQFRKQKADGTWGDLGVPPPLQPPLLDKDDTDLFGSVFGELLSVNDLSSKKDVPTGCPYDPLAVYAYIADNNGMLELDPQEVRRIGEEKKQGEYLTRVNHLSTFADACRDIAKSVGAVAGGKAPKTPVWTSPITDTLSAEFEENWLKPAKEGKFPPKASVSAPSVIGKGYSPSEGAVVKATIIGNNVKVGANSRISQCVILDNAVIGAGCVLQGSIVGSDSIIPDRVTLKECILGNGLEELEEGSEYKNETISKEDF